MSPTASDRLIGVRAKTERAEQHIRDVEGAIRAFRLDAYDVGEKTDAQTGQCVYYLSRADEVPPFLGCIIGDAIHNLRSALDHLAMQLHIAGDGGQDDRIYFPIFDSAERYETEMLGEKQSARQDAVKLFNETEPYQGGAGHNLWLLNKLNNIDKHRRLNVVGVNFGGFWTHPDVIRRLKASAKANPAIIATEMPPGYYFRTMDRSDPLKVGDELFRCPARAKLDAYDEFTFEVAFCEPSVVECQPVLEFLHDTSDLVRNIVDQFVPLL